MNIYVGNFSLDTSEEDLKTAFEGFGSVDVVKIIKDKYTGDARGFGFVEMPNKGEAMKAIEELKEINGRMVVINEARPQKKNSFGGGRNGVQRNRRNNGRRGGGY